jgi:putative ABC transport system permease protein
VKRWLRSWRVALRTARREAWRRPADVRRSVLVAVLVGLPVLAASAYVVLLTPQPASQPQKAAVLSGLPAGAVAVLSSFQPGQQVTQDEFASSMGSTTPSSSEPTGPVTLGEAVAGLKSRLPGADRLLPVRDVEVVAFGADQGDRYQITARLVGTPVGAGAGPAPTSLIGTGRVLAGTLPGGGNQVAVNPELAALLHLTPGAAFSVGQPADPTATRRTVTVSGVVELKGTSDPAAVGGATAVVASLDATPLGDYILSQAQVIVTGPEPVTWAHVQAVNALGWTVLSRHVIEQQPDPTTTPGGTYSRSLVDPDPARVALQTEIVGLVVLQLVLLAAPAMAVGARRRQRALALAAVAGADRAQVRRTVLALGGSMGGPGALVGALAGVGLTMLLPGDAWGLGAERPGWDQVPWLAVAILAVAGLVVAVLAAAVPAVVSARLDPIAVLKGRRVSGATAPRTPWLGLALLVLGTATTLVPPYLGLSRSMTRALVSVLGIGVAEVGLILTLPAALALLARAARGGPLFLRLALRDADRHRLRTVPAVAAVTAAVAGSIAVQMFLTADDGRNAVLSQDRAPEDSLVLQLDASDPLIPADGDRWRAQVRRSLAGTGVHDVTPIWTLGGGGQASYTRGTWLTPLPSAWATTNSGLLPAPGACTFRLSDDMSAPLALCTSARARLHRPELRLGVAVGDGRTVRAQAGRELPEATRALASGRAVVTDPDLLWPDGTVRVRLWSKPGTASGSGTVAGTPTPTPTPTREFSVPAVVVDSPVLFEAVLPPDAVRRALPGADALLHAASAITDGRPSRFPPATSDDVTDRLRVISPSSSPSYLGYDTMVRDLAVLAFAALVTVFGAASAVALAAAEGRADAATLAAVGAAPRTRRRLAAMQALTVAGIGGLTGVASGLLAGWALIRTISGPADDLASPGVQTVNGVQASTELWNGWQATLPWVDVLGLGVGLPLVLAAAAYLLTRSRLPLTRRQT